MAATSLVGICRRASAFLKSACSLVNPKPPAHSGCRSSLHLLHENTPHATSFLQCKFLHTTLSRKGLEEFFDDPKNWGEEKVKSGASWTCQQLRNKSNEDLHKLCLLSWWVSSNAASVGNVSRFFWHMPLLSFIVVLSLELVLFKPYLFWGKSPMSCVGCLCGSVPALTRLWSGTYPVPQCQSWPGCGVKPTQSFSASPGQAAE
ncbi:large ribosomal subunit protein uL29m isoform X2 [Arvicanthis niloticus]|uniref:large ribosomal subunit protein uL29m isoform X2 n=1 Tax=Arvicanthis niloticus TaxID=61156 RepID=UPI00402B0A8B